MDVLFQLSIFFVIFIFLYKTTHPTSGLLNTQIRNFNLYHNKSIYFYIVILTGTIFSIKNAHKYKFTYFGITRQSAMSYFEFILPQSGGWVKTK